MNISQHSFVPRGKTLPGYYTLSGNFNGNSVSLTTEKQRGDVYNCFQFFGGYVPVSGTWYILRLFEPITPAQDSNFVGVGTTGYAQPELVKKRTVYSSSAFTGRVGSDLFVAAVMWYEGIPTVSSLSLRNSFTPDVIDGEVF